MAINSRSNNIRRQGPSWAMLMGLGLLFLIPTLALAQSELQARLSLVQTSLHRNSDNSWNFMLLGQIKNIGNSAYVRAGSAPSAYIHLAGRRQKLRTWVLPTPIRPGASITLRLALRHVSDNEFAPTYELVLDLMSTPGHTFGDRNPANNRSTLSRQSLLVAMARATNGILPPGLIRPRTIVPNRGFNPGLIAGSLLTGNLAAAVPKPDLIIENPSPRIGVVTVTNRGRANAPASKLLLKCRKDGYRGRSRSQGCPNVIARLPYSNSVHGYILEVPALHAGRSKQVVFPGAIRNRFNRGRYVYTFTADAAHTISESLEGNNTKTQGLTVR